MKITEDLVARANGLIKLQPEVRGEKYLMFDDGGVEVEVGEFLYGLVRLLKPEAVLTTGIYSGISDMYIGAALVDNDFGYSVALEYESYHFERAKTLWRVVGIDMRINPNLCSSLSYKTDKMFDLIFLDTEPNIRYAELERFYPNLKPGGFIGIHDCPRNMTQGNINPDHPEISSWPFGNIPEKMAGWLKSGELIKFHFPNPRGMVFFYKPHPEDHHVA